MIYLDNSATTGRKPAEVILAVQKALNELSANPGRSGHKKGMQATTAIYRVRERVADFFGAEGAEQVIFTSGCTAAVNFVLKGVLKRTDHIIVSSLEHNAVMRPLVKTGINYDIAEVSNSDEETLENFKRLIKPNTKMVFCTAASNVTGRILPIEKIGEIAKNHGILFGVDAAQGSGVIEIDMKKMNIDYLCVAGHKGLYAPMGIGVLIARRGIENTLLEGGTGSNSESFDSGNTIPEDFESGTVNLPGILGLGGGIDFVKRKGVKNIYNHEFSLAKRLYNGISKIPLAKLYTDGFEKGKFVPVVSFNLGKMNSAEVADLLNRYNIAARGGLHCAPLAHSSISTLKSGTVRLSPSVFNTAGEIDFTLKVIDKISRTRKD
ncbi:MAG: aminotransferase class V-fold PLP-dependent enzyme [Oscillospiraceae bacterium]|nr:aminotransferase class V-fold PLP-dependent enzyme [Oscillospiraceae bacterium]